MKNILFIDIETISSKQYFVDLDEEWKEFWIKKSHQINAFTENPEESYHAKAAIYAEFGKVICISVGTTTQNNEKQTTFVLKSIFGKEEKKLLLDFSKLLQDFLSKNNDVIFSGHNIAEFDIPFLCRRFVVNQIPIPPCLNFQHKKPWEVQIYDTLKLWKFGDYKHYTSLSLLTKVLNVPSPKYDLDGSKIGDIYYFDNDLPRIVHYCEEDVIAVARLYQKMTFTTDNNDWNIIRQTTFNQP